MVEMEDPDGGCGVREGFTGKIVVYNAIVSVVTDPIFAGQFVTGGAQEVIV